MSENLTPELENNQEEEVRNIEQEEQSPNVDEVNNLDNQTKEELIQALRDMVSQEGIPQRVNVEPIKRAFYKLRSAEVEALKTKFIEDGGVVEDFAPIVDELEEELKNLLATVKEKRAKAIEAEEKVKEQNLAKKLAIIESIKTLNESSDDFGKIYKEFKALQDQWSAIKAVPQGSVNDLWRAYQQQIETFYDLLKINNELRDYDFKKNLELKTALCEAVEKLKENENVISAFHQLQNFHQQWREIGPVAKELREDLWTRFKDASTEINKNHQSHFESLKDEEEVNLVAKRAICDELKVIDYSQLNTFKDWDDKSKEVIELQAKWKTIGFVPKKVNTSIFEEFRSYCDEFFKKKSEFFKDQKDEMQVNLDKKRVLCEKAVALKESEDWAKTTAEMVAMQKEWKTIGAVPRKYSDALWNEFVGACDHFFERKKNNFSSQKEEEKENLDKKKDLVTRILALDQALDAKETIAQLKEFMAEWQTIGFVPFKEKDKIYKEYQAALDAHFDRVKVDKAERRFQDFKSNIDGLSSQERPKQKLMSERNRLIYRYEKVKSDLQAYENNMGFLSISGNAGGLFKDMNNKIEGLKSEMELILKKIETLDDSLDNI